MRPLIEIAKEYGHNLTRLLTDESANFTDCFEGAPPTPTPTVLRRISGAYVTMSMLRSAAR